MCFHSFDKFYRNQMLQALNNLSLARRWVFCKFSCFKIKSNNAMISQNTAVSPEFVYMYLLRFGGMLTNSDSSNTTQTDCRFLEESFSKSNFYSKNPELIQKKSKSCMIFHSTMTNLKVHATTLRCVSHES